MPSDERRTWTTPFTLALNWNCPLALAMKSHVGRKVTLALVSATFWKSELITWMPCRYPFGFMIGKPTHRTEQCFDVASFMTFAMFFWYCSRHGSVLNAAA